MVTENLQVNKVSVSCLQIKNGIYQAVLEYYDKDGKRHQPWRSTGLKERGNKKQALIVAENIRTEFEKKLQVRTTCITRGLLLPYKGALTASPQGLLLVRQLQLITSNP